jgi:hypothetical protein
MLDFVQQIAVCVGIDDGDGTTSTSLSEDTHTYASAADLKDSPYFKQNENIRVLVSCRVTVASVDAATGFPSALPDDILSLL